MANTLRTCLRRPLSTSQPRLSNTLRSLSTSPFFPHSRQPQPTHQTHTQPTSWSPVPLVTENFAGGWRTSDIYSRLLQERIICLTGEVDQVSSSNIVAQLLFLEADAPEKPISLYINSPGGSVTAGLAIYDTMMYIKSPVSTICMGQAASMGSLLLCGGAEGQRYCLPHSSVMIHQPSGGFMGTAADIAIHAKEILRLRDRLNKIYQRHLSKKRTLEEIEKFMERDYFMDANEALEFGIVDKVLERRTSDELEGGKID
ncbi:hypothetical protein M011DRAFT_522753 [Sporormia fimetaria CBS 119925]|uniref:ATP-dependent Clp protease proteolytic subunit n=1 Tax=Sporormia fimetaria CBS 119925 TaxID=1340428 RepID=A0A6A6VPU0_9PLEO|nr:hypothetical protein M011DRAFT_522753 [Sporormia fimetaria CBS 119925]